MRTEVAVPAIHGYGFGWEFSGIGEFDGLVMPGDSERLRSGAGDEFLDWVGLGVQVDKPGLHSGDLGVCSQAYDSVELGLQGMGDFLVSGFPSLPVDDVQEVVFNVFEVGDRSEPVIVGVLLSG